MKLRPRLTGSTVPTPLLLAILAESSVARAEQPDAPCHPNPDAAAETVEPISRVPVTRLSLPFAGPSVADQPAALPCTGRAGLTDIYALGVCVYEMLTGQVPFFHAELVPLLMMHVNDQPVPPRRRNPNVPVELDVVILRSLAKDPKQRQQSCRELGQELIAIRDRYA